MVGLDLSGFSKYNYYMIPFGAFLGKAERTLKAVRFLIHIGFIQSHFLITVPPACERFLDVDGFLLCNCAG